LSGAKPLRCFSNVPGGPLAVPFRIIGKAPASCRLGVQSRDPSVRGLSPTPVFPPGTFLAISLHSSANRLAYVAHRYMGSNHGRRQRGHRPFHRTIATTGSTAGRAAWCAATAVTPVAVMTTRCQCKESERERDQQKAKAHGGIPLFLGCTATRGSHATVLEDTWFASQGTEGWDGGMTHTKTTAGEAGPCGTPPKRHPQQTIKSMRPECREATTPMRPSVVFPRFAEKGCERCGMDQTKECC
jgi:hypothetical protein